MKNIMLRQNRLIKIVFLFLIVFIFSKSYAADTGYDFVNEARLIHRVVACGPGQLPEGMDVSIVETHCREVGKRIENVRKDFVSKSRPFIAALLPNNLPKSVIYPFGGGDLLTALVTYPDATEFTIISLESAGDPRRLSKAGKKELSDSLSGFREMVVHLLVNHDSKNGNLRAFERGIIPGQLAFSLAAASVYGYEPVSLKYFRIEPDGSLYYYTKQDIAGLEKTIGKKLAKFWVDTDFSIVFRNMELVLRKTGNMSGPETIVHRHIAANLDNQNFLNSPLKKHLESKGKISAMTKAGSYLLWFDDFSAIRNYMLTNMAFMVSDSTGILPRHANAAGFEQITYGKFFGPFLDQDKDFKDPDAESFRKLWKSQPYRELPFRYGYSDIKAASHLMITKPNTAGNNIPVK
jgi:hypothetical protein